jgi:hypothetical protein
LVDKRFKPLVRHVQLPKSYQNKVSQGTLFLAGTAFLFFR